jgi:hypothetical protein
LTPLESAARKIASEITAPSTPFLVGYLSNGGLDYLGNLNPMILGRMDPALTSEN